MRVLLLGQRALNLSGCFPGAEITLMTQRMSLDSLRSISPDVAISLGYKYKLTGEMLALPSLGCLNIHISALPWNRGSDPNFWSWLENTPKGVTFHQMDENLDTGPRVLQEELEMASSLTLRESYDALMSVAESRFPEALGKFLDKDFSAPDDSIGTFHRVSDLEPYRFLLAEQGWDTPAYEILEYGRTKGLWRLAP